MCSTEGLNFDGVFDYPRRLEVEATNDIKFKLTTFHWLGKESKIEASIVAVSIVCQNSHTTAHYVRDKKKHRNNMFTRCRCTILSVQLFNGQTDPVANKRCNAELSLNLVKAGCHIDLRTLGCRGKIQTPGRCSRPQTWKVRLLRMVEQTAEIHQDFFHQVYIEFLNCNQLN